MDKRATVKICGLRSVEDIQMCIRHGADIVGFVTEYPHPVPWNLSVAEAKELLKAANGAKTAVVTGGEVAYALRIAEQLRPDYLQYHHAATAKQVRKLAEGLHSLGVQLIQVVSAHAGDIAQIAQKYYSAGAHILLLDSRNADGSSEGGVDFSNWDVLRVATDLPLMLAGGITPDNVAEILHRSQAYMIDLMSGVESTAGVKDEAKIIALFQEIIKGHSG